MSEKFVWMTLSIADGDKMVAYAASLILATGTATFISVLANLSNKRPVNSPGRIILENSALLLNADW